MDGLLDDRLVVSFYGDNTLSAQEAKRLFPEAVAMREVCRQIVVQYEAMPHAERWRFDAVYKRAHAILVRLREVKERR